MEKIKLIFLEVDGVLNSYDKVTYYKYCAFKHIPILKNFVKYGDIDEKFIKRLSKICRSTNAKVVLSSSWKNSLLDDNLIKINDTKMSQSFWNYMDKYGIEVIGKTPNITLESRKNTRRSDEIIAWLTKHQDKYDIQSFIILDDESYDLFCFRDSNLILTTNPHYDPTYGKLNEHGGLKNHHVRESIKKLNKTYAFANN